MDIRDIKQNYSTEILRRITTPDKSGRGWVCPLCGSGKGEHGTGLVAVPGKPGYFKCFSSGCDFYGDILELLGKLTNQDDTVRQIQEAEKIIGVPLFDKKSYDNGVKVGSRQENKKVSEDKGVKNMGETNNKKLPSETVTDTERAVKMEQYVQDANKRLQTSTAGLSYLQGRGISLETANRFNLGYTERYADTYPNPAIIIPTGRYSFTARATNTDTDKVRKSKVSERAGIFGINCLKDNPSVVYVVEGEFDALAIYEAGLQAIATGGGTGKRAVVEEIKSFPNLKTIFIIVPDNDRNDDGTPDLNKGYKTGQELHDAMIEAGIPCALLDTSNPDKWDADLKDVNDLLVKDRDGCRSFLQGIYTELVGRALGRSSLFLDEFIKQSKGNTPPIPTTFEPLDDILDGGLRPGLVILGAISSLGKTTFCLNLSERIARSGHDVLFFSLEMSKYELISKIISCNTIRLCCKYSLPTTRAKTNIGVSDFERWKKYSDEEKFLLQQSFEEFEKNGAGNLYIKDGLHEYGTTEIRRDVKRHIELTGRVPVVIVDYIQILKTPDPRLSDKQKTDTNILEMKLISRDFNVPLIGISSFNRENYTEPVTMKAYKESGVIEYTSDILIGIQHDGMDYIEGEKSNVRDARVRQLLKENTEKAGRGEGIDLQIKVLKSRSGKRGSCILRYFPMFNYYEELTKLPFGM